MTSEARTAVRPVASSWRGVVSDYFEMTKPKVQSLLLFTTITTMYVAGDPSLGLVALTCLGGALSAGGAGAINHALDRDIDRVMKRTANRPVASGRVSPAAAIVFGVVLGCASFALLSLTVNPLAAVLSMSGLLGYVLVYTMWLKRSTPQNIVIGGAAGAVPPLVAWAAVTGGLGGTPLYLFAIVFFWTPPHFWALSLLMKDEYAQGRGADAAGRARRARDAPPDPALHGAAVRREPAALLRGRLRRDIPGLLGGARGRLHLRRLAPAARAVPAHRPAPLPLLARPISPRCSPRWWPTPGCSARQAGISPPSAGG